MKAEAKRKNFDEIINSSPLVLVDFFAEWCGPCKMMKPVLEEVKAIMGDAVKIIKVDVEKNINTASRYNVMGVPTLILFREGKSVWRRSGVVTPGELTEVIQRSH